MIIKNNEIESIGKFLLELPLRGRQSLMRTRFVKLLQARLDLQNEERQQLINEFAQKDEHGEFVYSQDESGQEGLKINDPKEFNREMIKLMTEDFIIEESEDKREMFTELKDVIVNYDEEISGDKAMVYDALYELFDEV
ncbi:hypothetical protein [Psychrobacillus phage Perkons]|nr:hypothetical protein [Psychrobacillus phage Perkons]